MRTITQRAKHSVSRRRFRPAVLVGCALLAVAAGLTACAQTVNGTTPSGPPPALTHTPSPTPTTIPDTPTQTTSTPTSPTTTPTTPTTTAPTTTTPATPRAQLEREAPRTVIGDPVTADFCLGGANFLNPTGLLPHESADQPLGGCEFRLARNGVVQFRVYEYALEAAPADIPASYTRTLVTGRPVYTHPLQNGECIQYVVGAGLLMEVQAVPSAIDPTSPLLCRGADLTSARVVTLMNRGHDLPRLELAHPSVTALDACKVAQAADLATDRLVGTPRFTRESFGSQCEVDGTRLTMFFSTVIATRAALHNYHRIEVGSHVLYQATFSTARTCYLSSVQATIGNTAWREQFEAIAQVRGSRAVPNLCGEGGQLLGDFLDAAGLN